MPIPKSQLTVRVQKKQAEALDVVSLTLESVDGTPLPEYSAGSHIDITLPNGIIRQYSLSKASNEHGVYEIAVLREPNSRGGSESVHRDLQVGDALVISHPRNLFPLTKSGLSILFAGGIGVTPILAMAEDLHQQGRKFEFYYCSRSSDRSAYKEYIQNSEWSEHAHFHFDSEVDGLPFDAKKVLSGRGQDAHMYVCGPQGFIKFICDSAKQLDWPNEQVHFEHFSAPETPATEGKSFELVLARKGISIMVPADVSPAQALLDNGVEVALSCEQGVCGSCVLPVLDGVPEHHDVFLNASERESNRFFTPCCSRSLTPKLVVDL